MNHTLVILNTIYVQTCTANVQHMYSICTLYIKGNPYRELLNPIPIPKNQVIFFFHKQR